MYIFIIKLKLYVIIAYTVNFLPRPQAHREKRVLFIMIFLCLASTLPGVATQKMLTNQLRSLESDNLITRTVYPVVPPKVEYNLSDMGKKMIPLLEKMYSYGIDYLHNNGK